MRQDAAFEEGVELVLHELRQVGAGLGLGREGCGVLPHRPYDDGVNAQVSSIQRYSGVNWLDDGTGFFYARLAEGYEKQPPDKQFNDRTVHFRALDESRTDRAIVSPSRNPELKLPGYAWPSVFQVPDRPTVIALFAMGVDRNLKLMTGVLPAATEGKALWQPFVEPSDEVSSFTMAAGQVYFRSGKGAPRYCILRLPITESAFAKAEQVVPEGEGVIAQIAAAADALYFTRREGVNTSLYRLPHSAGVGAAPERVQLPVVGEVEIRSYSDKRPGVVVGLAS